MNRIDEKFQELITDLKRKSKEEIFTEIKDTYIKALNFFKFHDYREGVGESDTTIGLQNQETTYGVEIEANFEDAKIILNMSNNEISLVGKNVTGSRMNEYKTHYNWANKIINLYKIYGTIDE